MNADVRAAADRLRELQTWTVRSMGDPGIVALAYLEEHPADDLESVDPSDEGLWRLDGWDTFANSDPVIMARRRFGSGGVIEVFRDGRVCVNGAQVRARTRGDFRRLLRALDS